MIRKKNLLGSNMFDGTIITLISDVDISSLFMRINENEKANNFW